MSSINTAAAAAAAQADNATKQGMVDESTILPSSPKSPSKKTLEEHLMRRPKRDELVEKNILPASTAAPSLQASQLELAKHMRADSLNEKISHRPSPETLLHEGKLHNDPRSPEPSAEERYLEAMEDEYAKREGGA